MIRTSSDNYSVSILFPKNGLTYAIKIKHSFYMQLDKAIQIKYVS